MPWTETTLGELVTLQRGFDLPTKSRIPGNVPVLSAGKKIASHNQAKVAGPGFVIGRSSNLGIPKWSDTDFWPLNTTLFAKDFKGNNPKWLFYLFQTIDLTGFNSGTAQASLNRNHISGFRVTAPSRPEQDRIVDVLGSLDDKTTANNHVLAVIDETIQALWQVSATFDAGLVCLGDVVEFNPKISVPKGTLVKTIEMKNLPESGFSVQEWVFREAKSGSRFQNDDTLLARITPCFENGKCGFVDFLSTDEVGSGSTEFIVMRPPSGVPPAAPYAIARSTDFRTFAEQTMTGTSGRQRVQHGDLGAYETAWPSKESLTTFDSATSPLLKLARKIRDENLTLTKTRDELLPLLMNGKITVREAEQEATAAGTETLDEEHEV